MKLRFVKFLTSRENEIEKKEEGGRRTNITCSTTLIQASARVHAPAPFSLSSSLHLPTLSSSTILRQQVPSPPPQLVCRHVPPSSCSSYPSPAVPLLPFFFIKLLKQQGMAYVAWRCTQPAGPASRSSQPTAGAQLAAPLPLHQIRCRDSSPVLMASSLWRMEPQENKDRK